LVRRVFRFFTGLRLAFLRRFPAVLNLNLIPAARNAFLIPRASLGFFAVNVRILAITHPARQISNCPP
jgi:hypothetical protein